MITSLVRSVLSSAWASVILVVVLIAAGVHAYRALPIDAVPDVSNVQVQVLTQAPGLSPLEVEARISQLVERALAGVPRVARVRSVSRAAISAVTLVFEPGTNLLDARELVVQRLPSVSDELPPGMGPSELGPLTTGLGEVYHFTSRWPGHSLQELRTLVDWELAPRLSRVPGVVEVNSWGGDRRQVVVQPDRIRMQSRGVTETMLVEALKAGGASIGAGMVEHGEEGTFIRVDATYKSREQIAGQLVRKLDGESGPVPVLIEDVASVNEGVAPRFSAATADGQGETIYTMVQMLAGANAHRVVADTKVRLSEIEETLPPGVLIEPFYDRAAFVEEVLHTVKSNLLEGGVIVALVLLLMLGSLRAGLVVASVIPLSMLGAFWLMRQFGISGNLLSLGAIDFGLVVDGAVVIVEGTLAAMAAHRLDARGALARVATEVGRPVTLAVAIIAVVYLPVLLLEGVEGKMFRPMALTVLFALATAFVLTFTWVPVLASVALPQKQVREPWIARRARSIYQAVLTRALYRWRLVTVALLLLVVSGVAVISRLGGEFVPRLEEGSLAIQLTRPPSVSLTEAIEGTTRVERALQAFPEVERVVSRIGSPDVATDVMGIEQADVLVRLKPRAQWTTATDAAGFAEALQPVLRQALPGTGFAFTQPIEMRVSELIGGVQSDLGVKVYGHDLQQLRAAAEEVASRIQSVVGASDVRVEPTHGQQTLSIEPSPKRLAQNGVAASELALHVQSLRQGVVVGEYLDGLRRFDVVVRQAAPDLRPHGVAGSMLVSDVGTLVPLPLVATVSLDEGPAQVSREQGLRRVLVETNVRGRDLASFVGEVQNRLKDVRLPTGSFIEYGGEYENLQRAATRLLVIVPVTLGVVLLLLYWAFGRMRGALLVFINIPAAISGGAFALAIRGLDLSMSAAVGFLALFGVATLNGVVLMTAILARQREGMIPANAVFEAATERLRPVLTTALVAALGFLPMAIATGTGAEVQRPLASVVIGGLVTSTFVTLLFMPVITLRFGER